MVMVLFAMLGLLQKMYNSSAARGRGIGEHIFGHVE